MSTYVINLDQLTVENMKAAASLTKNDQLILLSPPEGAIPLLLYPYMSEIKAKIEPMIIPGVSDNYIAAYLLGLLSSCVSDYLYIVIDNNNPLAALNHLQFNNAKGIYETQIFYDFQEAINGSLVNISTHKGKKKKENNFHNEKSEPLTFCGAVKDENCSLPLSNSAHNISEKLLVKPETEHYYPNIAPAPSSLLARLKNLNTTDVDLVVNAKYIAEALRHSADGILSFEMQLQLFFGKENSSLIYNIIKDRYDILAALV